MVIKFMINQYLIKMNYIDKLRCDIEFNINNNINILSEKRNTKILDLLNFILININCLKKINFDKIIKSKCKEYMNPLSFDYVISSKEDKEKLILTRSRMLQISQDRNSYKKKVIYSFFSRTKIYKIIN